MSAFNDYCLVCEQICDSSSVYCSDSCKSLDLIKQQQQTNNHHSHNNNNNNNNNNDDDSFVIEDIDYNQLNTPALTTSSDNLSMQLLSPILTPSLTYQKFNNSYTTSNNSHHNRGRSNSNLIHYSPISSFSYDSPILLSSHSINTLNHDLDSNQLDLNISNGLNNKRKSSINTVTDNNSITTNVSDLLSNCASENYKKWLSSSITKH